MSADGSSVIVTGRATSATPYIYVIDSRFRVNNTLNVYNNTVGVGTNIPTSNLHIIGNVYASNAVTTTNVFASTANIATLYTTNIIGFTGSQWTTGTGNVYYTGGVGIGTSSVSSNLTVQGNVYASNAVTTTNVFASTANIATLYTTNIIGFTGSQWTTGTGNVYYTGGVGIGTSSVSSNLTVQGNVYASNAVSTPNVFTGNLFVTGNTTASNVVTIQQLGTGNVFSTSNASGQVGLFVSSTSNVGIGTTNPSSYTLQVVGTIGSTGDFTVYYSDDRLKTRTGRIENALEKVLSLEAFTYVPNDLAKSFGFQDSKQRVGLSAQSVQRVLPEAVCPAPFDADNQSQQGYLTIQYEKVVPLLVEAIKELHEKINMK
jgi:hypothetical protein